MSVEESAPGVLSRVSWPVRTERLTIRPARLSDAEAVWRYRQLAEVSWWLGAWVRDHAQWSEFFRSRSERTLVIELDGMIIGDLMLRIYDGWAQSEVSDQARNTEAELGWVLDPGQAGRGYATEAVGAVIGLCFTALGVRRVTANCFAANEPSWRLMERLGMRREVQTSKDSLHRELGWQDGYGYALLAEEWLPG